MQKLSLCNWLSLHAIMSLSFIHFIVYGKIFFFFLKTEQHSTMYICVYITFSLGIYLLLDIWLILLSLPL